MGHSVHSGGNYLQGINTPWVISAVDGWWPLLWINVEIVLWMVKITLVLTQIRPVVPGLPCTLTPGIASP